MKTLSSNDYSNRKKVSVYEWIRIIGTIFVVIGHSAYVSISSQYGEINYAMPEHLAQLFPFKALDAISRYIAAFHMPLFFFLSGAVLHLKPLKPLKEFIIGKSKRLLIPYVFVGLLFMFPIKYFTGFYSSDSFIKSVLSFFVSTGDSGHLWFLVALFLCMIIFVLMVKILTKFNLYNEYALLLISIILQWISASNITTEVLGIKKALGYIFWFALGYCFEKIRKAISIKQALFLSICYVMLLCLNSLELIILPYEMIILVNCFGIYLVSELFSMLFSKIEENKAYKIFVRNLFNIYLFHDPLEYIVLKLFMDSNWLNNDLGCYIYMFCRIVVVIIVSVLIGEILRVLSTGLKKIKQKITNTDKNIISV